ncbi:MAG TPA: ROK family protein, partial [Candidatus Nitrosotalea sp.]|nr:ROK family protein [Candidatus Nitrosotalea sp.]
LGGTKVEITALDDAGSELVRRRIPTPAGDYAATLDAIANLVVSVEADLGRIERVGVGTPGAISPATGLLQNSNSTVLNGKPLERDLAARLQRPVRIANDANCFAISEALDGAGAGCRVVFGVILGTGCGGGIVVAGRPIVGRMRIAGEWGHNPLPWPRPAEQSGPRCYCGKQGCLETYLSGPALAREFFIATGRDLTAEAIAAAADAGEHDASEALERYEDRLARGLSCVVNLLDPDAIVLGGGLSRIERLYANVPRIMARYVFSRNVDVTVVRARHGDSSGVRGAARLWSVEDLAGA